MRYRHESLLPCPFCGGAASLISADDFGQAAIRARCRTCSAMAKAVPYGAGLPRFDAEGRFVDRNLYVPYAAAVLQAQDAWNARAEAG